MKVANDALVQLLSESEAGSKSDQNIRKSETATTFVKYVVYVALTVSLGALETLGSSTYHQLETQLSTTSTHVAFILSVKAISSAVGGLVTAFVLQYIRHSHRYMATCCTVIAVTIALMTHTQSLAVMFAIYVIIGYYLGVVFVAYPVYIFRIYPLTQSRALFACMVIYGVSKTTFPLIIDLSTHVYGSYGPALYPICAIALLCASALCCLSTPQHDPLREMHQSAVSLTRIQFYEIKEKMRENDSIKWYKRSLLAILTLMAFCFSAFQSATVNFALKYAINGPAQSTANVGRYLISCYYAGQLFYRLIAATCCREMQPARTILASNLILNIIGASFVFINFVDLGSTQINIACLFGIYINIGFFASPIFPGILKFIELVKTLSGLLSGLITVMFALGDSSTVFLIGLLINDFGIRVVPIFISGYMFLFFCVAVAATVMFGRLATLKDDVTYSVVNTPRNSNFSTPNNSNFPILRNAS